MKSIRERVEQIDELANTAVILLAAQRFPEAVEAIEMITTTAKETVKELSE